MVGAFYSTTTTTIYMVVLETIKKRRCKQITIKNTVLKNQQYVVLLFYYYLCTIYKKSYLKKNINKSICQQPKEYSTKKYITSIPTTYFLRNTTSTITRISDWIHTYYIKKYILIQLVLLLLHSNTTNTIKKPSKQNPSKTGRRRRQIPLNI